MWDFGHLLPAGLIDYGLGVTPPVPQPERDRVFVFSPDLSRGYLDLDMEEHAKAGGDSHEAKARVVSSSPTSELVVYEGQLLVNSSGYIGIAVPRAKWWTDGKEIWQRFIFELATMPYDLQNLVVHGDNVKIENSKVFFQGVQL